MRKYLNCLDCNSLGLCCGEGVWVDLDEAKDITAYGIFKGEFSNLKKDRTFPSGWKVSSSYNDGPCTFLDRKGLCNIHKTDFDLKPKYCKEFPIQDGKTSPSFKNLCKK